VPVGVFLSGGLDSSLIAALAAKARPGIDTFSMGFSADSDADESRFAELVARHVGSRHHAFRFDATSFLPLFADVAAALDEPVGDPAQLPLLWLCREARQVATVVLSGEGADELFGGYNYYAPFAPAVGLRERWARWRSRPAPAPSARLLETDERALASGFPFVLSRAQRRALLADGALRDPDEWERELLAKLGTARDPLQRASAADLLTWLPDDLLVKLDRMAMATSLEGRAPYLDPKLAELALALPPAERTTVTRRKVALARAAAPLLPREILEREKHGFVLPMKRWLAELFASEGGAARWFAARPLPPLDGTRLVPYLPSRRIRCAPHAASSSASRCCTHGTRVPAAGGARGWRRRSRRARDDRRVMRRARHVGQRRAELLLDRRDPRGRQRRAPLLARRLHLRQARDDLGRRAQLAEAPHVAHHVGRLRDQLLVCDAQEPFGVERPLHLQDPVHAGVLPRGAEVGRPRRLLAPARQVDAEPRLRRVGEVLRALDHGRRDDRPPVADRLQEERVGEEREQVGHLCRMRGQLRDVSRRAAQPQHVGDACAVPVSRGVGRVALVGDVDLARAEEPEPDRARLARAVAHHAELREPPREPRRVGELPVRAVEVADVGVRGEAVVEQARAAARRRDDEDRPVDGHGGGAVTHDGAAVAAAR
jgi:hypothetical protein